MLFDNGLGHVRGDAAKEDTDPAHPEHLRDRLVEILGRDVAEAGVIDEIERLVLKGKNADAAEDIPRFALLGGAGMDQRIELNAPGLDALGFEALQGEAVSAAAVEQLPGRFTSPSPKVRGARSEWPGRGLFLRSCRAPSARRRLCADAAHPRS